LESALIGPGPEAVNEARRAARGPRFLLAAAAVVGVAGVTPWLAFALRIDALYRPILKGAGYRAAFHPVAEVQGFLSLVGAALLFAVLPRRTGASGARAWECALAAACGLAAPAAAWADRWDLAQAAWTGLAAVAAGFVLARRRWAAGALDGRAGAWLVAAGVAAIAGSVLATVGARNPRGALHDVGRALLWQGVFTALTIAVAARRAPHPGPLPAGRGEGDLRPTSTRLSPSPSRSRSRIPSPLLHGLGAGLLLATFALDALVSRRAGFAARAAVTLAFAGAPALAGLRSRIAPERLAAAALAALPAGYTWAAIDPVHRRAGLHLIYLGCFTGLAILAWSAVGGRWRPSPAARWAAGLLAVALAARVVLELDAPSFHLWLGVACAAFMAGVVTWAAAALRGAP
jgi:hypothetical protein